MSREAENFHHPVFGDLTSLNAVVFHEPPRSDISFQEHSPTYIHLSITGRCFGRCQGCINAAITSSFDGERSSIVPIGDTQPERDAACILNLVREQPGDDALVCFYGGEPLLETGKIAAVASILEASSINKAINYMIYTNGELLTRAINEYPLLIRSIWLYTVSIDGRQNQHDSVRKGTHLDVIHDGLAALKKIRTGTVLMWSTLREEQSLIDCFHEFLYLFENGYADQFFWHWLETTEPLQNELHYRHNYEKDLRNILEAYIEWLQNGKILPIVHINELVLYLLTGKKRGSSACGVELAENFDLIDGKIHSCADLPPELAIGHIDEQGNPHINSSNLHTLVGYKDELKCYDCGVHFYCGGRCPVQAYDGITERMHQYCRLMRVHVGVVMEQLDTIAEAMEKNGISAQQLYDNSAIYTQFTDVTP